MIRAALDAYVAAVVVIVLRLAYEVVRTRIEEART